MKTINIPFGSPAFKMWSAEYRLHINMDKIKTSFGDMRSAAINSVAEKFGIEFIGLMSTAAKFEIVDEKKYLISLLTFT